MDEPVKLVFDLVWAVYCIGLVAVTLTIIRLIELAWGIFSLPGKDDIASKRKIYAAARMACLEPGEAARRAGLGEGNGESSGR